MVCGFLPMMRLFSGCFLLSQARAVLERVVQQNHLAANGMLLNPETLNVKPQTSNIKPQTSNLKPQTSNLNPQPQTSTLNPKPQNMTNLVCLRHLDMSSNR